MSTTYKLPAAEFIRGFWRAAISAPLAILALVVGLSYGKFEKPTPALKPLLAGAQISPAVLSTVQRACQNCHSANTEWPLYSAIPPLSWQIHHDVARARGFMDLSRWNEYSDGERRGYLISIVAALRTHAMPPRRYVWMHPEARLSEAESLALENWAVTEQQRLWHLGAPARFGLGTGD